VLLLRRRSTRTGGPSAAEAKARHLTSALPLVVVRPRVPRRCPPPRLSFWNPWTESIQMWPGPRPPLAPLPPRPQQQALLAQPSQQQAALRQQQASSSTSSSLGRCTGPGHHRPVGSPLRVLPSHGRDALLGSAVPRLHLQHHDAEPAAAKQRVVFRLRCYLSHGLSFRHSFTYFSHAVSYYFYCCQ